MRPTSAVTIHDAVSPLEVNAFGGLISEYVAWCRERYKNDPWLIEMAFSYQGLDEELLKLTELYGPPNGRMLIAEDAYEVLGGVAYKRVDARTCEMKRMFVRTAASGRGIGRLLCKAIMQAAAKDGFEVMRLDTSREMVEAIGLYKAFGFREVAPFIEYPERMRPMMIFMERSLSDIG